MIGHVASPPDRVGTAIELATAADFVTVHGDAVRFTHPLLAEAVIVGAGPGRKKEMHRRLAGVVTDPEERARHLALGAEGSNQVAAVALDEAAGLGVIVGHVDSKQGPAVFYRLGELAPSSLVHIALADRTEVLFRVYAVREYPKAAFPTSLVYGATPAPELRLVTCGGPFDEKTGHYLDNVVVFASYAGPGAARLH